MSIPPKHLFFTEDVYRRIANIWFESTNKRELKFDRPFPETSLDAFQKIRRLNSKTSDLNRKNLRSLIKYGQNFTRLHGHHINRFLTEQQTIHNSDPDPLPSQVYLVSSNMSWVGLFPSVAAIACIIGSVFGFMYKYINRQLTLSLLVALQGIATIFMPYSTNVWQLYLSIFVYGLGIGAWNNSNNVILIEMWQQASPSFLQFSQFIYGVGTILGPLLVGPYLSGEIDYEERLFLPNATVVTVWNASAIADNEFRRRESIEFP